MTEKSFDALMGTAPENLRIIDSMLKARSVLSRHKRIATSISGGSDSDCTMDLLEMVKPANCEIIYVFFDTGLEYAANIRQLDVLEKKYGVKIERRKAQKTVGAACREYGVPFISKDVSGFMSRLQAHGFDWNDSETDATPDKYGRCKSSLDWYFDRRPLSQTGKTKFSIKRLSFLREFVAANPPEFAISDKCCDWAKKRVAHEFDREYNPDLIVTGMRRAEGGRRAGSVKSCFTQGKDNAADNYRPLWYWTDADKAIYKLWRGLRYSDCYEVWALRRTGCCSCPCNSKAEQELAIVEQYEPKLAHAARSIFAATFDYKARYIEYKNQQKIQQRSAKLCQN